MVKKTLPQPNPSILNKDTAYRFPHLLLLEASAGAGKTHALASRYVQFLLSSHIPHNDLANLLAITFTKKAAQEMKDRILMWLKQVALGLDPAKAGETLALVDVSAKDLPHLAAKKVDEIIEYFSDFHIQTIDSFLSNVLKASALELGLGPDPEITTAYKPLQDYALSLMLREVSPDRDTLVRQAVDEFLAALNRASFNEIVWDPVSEFQSALRRLLETEAKHLAPLFFEDRSQEVMKGMEEIRRLYGKIASLGLDPRKGAKFPECLQALDAPGLLSCSHALPFNKGKQKELHREAEEQWKSLAPLTSRLAEDLSRTQVAYYGALFGPFRESLDRVKSLLGKLHISDITLRLAKFLSQDLVPEVYYRLGDRIDHFLVDEFQDTDPGQWRTIQPLLEEAFSKEGSLFAVGDLKQAIYLFRQADYRIMRNLIQAIRGEPTGDQSWLPPSLRNAAEVRPLGVNHRSDGVILEYVKQTFRERLKEWAPAQGFEDPTGLTTFEQDVRPERRDKGYVRVATLAPSSEADESTGPPVKAALKEILEDLQGRGYCLRDIAILAYRNQDIEAAVEWLTEWGYQATATSSLDIRKRKVVAELLLLLEFLDSPVNDSAFAGFLYGDFFLKAARKIQPGLERQHVLDFLAKVRTSSGRSRYLFQAFREDRDWQPLWDAFFEGLYDKVGYYPLYDLISLALQTFKVTTYFPEDAGAVLKFLEIISAWEDEGLNSIKKFLEMAGEEEEEAFSLALPEYLDAVQLLTFHKSKGLTFPVVVNLIDSSGARPERMVFTPEGGKIVVRHLTKDLIQHSPDLARLREQADGEALMQTLNLLYVISTRAEHELYNLLIPPTNRHAPEWFALFPDLEMGKKGAAEPHEAGRVRAPLDVECHALDIPFQKVVRAGWTALRQQEARRGDFFHRVLADLEYLPDPLEPTLGALLAKAQRLMGRDFDLPGSKAMLLALFSLPQFKSWFEPGPGREVQREAEYIDEYGLVYRMDRVLIDPGMVTVIDFKSGEAFQDEHREQVRRYLALLTRISPSKPVKGYLAYLDNLKIVEIV